MTVGSKTLLQRVLCSIEFLKGDIIVVTSGNGDLPPLSDSPVYRTVYDVFPGMGPLVGILTGLGVSGTDRNLVLAGDMPFLNRDFLDYMVRAAEGFDIVIPRWEDKIEPLLAVYTRNCLEPAEKMVREGDLSVRRLLEKVRVRYVDEREIARFDPGYLSFFNVNTGADLARARELAGRWEEDFLSGRSETAAGENPDFPQRKKEHQ